MNNNINGLHETGVYLYREWSLLYRGKTSSFEKLFEQDKYVTIHTKNLQLLATEVFKVYQNISPPILNEILHRRDINSESI